MRILRRFSIRSKLVLLAVVSVSLALLLAFAVECVKDTRALRQSKIEQIESLARMLAFNTTAVLTFQDRAAAEQILAAFASEPAVEYACLLDTDNHVLATYRTGAEAVAPPPAPIADGHRFLTANLLEIQRTVCDQGEKVGTLFIRAKMTDYHSQLAQQAKTVGVTMTGALLTAIALSILLQRAISSPLQRLSRTAESITTNRDYSLRVENDSGSEIGQLCTAFNRMLDEVERSKDALQLANDRLEQRVEDRTRQLTAEIDERRRVQEDLVRAKEDAEAANRAKSEFLANMSHEIRTPLNGVLGFTDLLLTGAERSDETIRYDYLRTIRSSGEHLLSLLNDILDLSKIEAGQMTVEHAACSPHELVSQVVSIMRAQALQKGLALDCEWSSPIPETIVTDCARLRQLLMNLVGNAVKFTEIGGVKLRCTVDSDRRRFSVDVVDTGPGIPPDKLEEVFDPFRQADNSVTRRFGGTGLGLAISRHLASSLRGELSVDSQVGRGSCFSFFVDTGPLDAVPMRVAPVSDALTVPSEGEGGTVDLRSDARILLVEDGPINRKLICAILEHTDVRIETAENGQIGVETAQAGEFDLILMDMQMPVMDGYAATRELRNAGFTIPIIALTAHAMKGDEDKCLSAGCSGYLTKPVNADHLVATIAQWLGTSKETKVTETEDRITNTSPETGTIAPLHSSLDMTQPIFRELVGEFVDYAKGEIDTMRSSLNEGNFEEVAQVAHRLKGAGGTAGFDSYTEPARLLEQAARQEVVDEVTQRLQLLEAITNAIVVPAAANA